MIPFQRFLDEHRDVVWRFSVASVGRQEADDVFQETFLAAMRAYPRLRAGPNLQAWVLTIAHRKALDHFRARKRRPRPAGRRARGPADHDPEPADDALWDAGPRAARQAARRGARCASPPTSTTPRSPRPPAPQPRPPAGNVHEGMKSCARR